MPETDKFGRPITRGIARRRRIAAERASKEHLKGAKAGGRQNAKRWEEIKKQRAKDVPQRLLAGIDHAEELMRDLGWRIY
jgi:hypothetical protein